MSISPQALLPETLRIAAGPIAAELRLILGGLAALLSLRLLRGPGRALYIRPLVNLIGRTLDRFTRLMDRLAAGRPLPAPRIRAPSHRPETHPARRVAPLPRRPGWLIAAIVNEAACYHSQLETLLARPEVQAILAAHPAALRVLAPIRRLLHIEPFNPARPRRLLPAPRPAAPWLPPPGPPRTRAPRPRPPFAWLQLPPPRPPPTPENTAPA